MARLVVWRLFVAAHKAVFFRDVSSGVSDYIRAKKRYLIQIVFRDCCNIVGRRMEVG